jgi:hypothetical protein
VDLVRRTVLYVASRLGEFDVKRLMYLLYLVDRELFYLCGFTLFSWRFVFSGLRSFDVYDVADELVDLGYLDKEMKESIVYRFVRERVKFELPRHLKDVVDKVLEKTKGIDELAQLEEHVLKRLDPNVVEIAGL